jgi:hypothetical protein
VVADANRWWKDAERECQKLVQERTLLQTQGSELCQAIVGPLKLRGHLLEGIQIAASHHTEMAKQFAVL